MSSGNGRESVGADGTFEIPIGNPVQEPSLLCQSERWRQDPDRQRSEKNGNERGIHLACHVPRGARKK
jgi:hypothetical protein